MSEFVDRITELAELNALLQRPGAQFITVYGRRRVGKTTLLLYWAQQAGWPYLYWVARHGTADAVRHSLASAVWRWAYPDTLDPEPPQFQNWETLFRQMARMIGAQPLLMIWDEFPYAVASDETLPSHLQAAWDHLFKETAVTLVLSGSHVGMMEEMMTYRAPLFGRFTGQLPVGPLPFSALKAFFPQYPMAERVATYAVLGGIPAYLERFDPAQSLSQNIRQQLFQRTGMFRSEPTVLVTELVRETRIYETMLRAIAAGQHTAGEIAGAVGLSSSNIQPYLKRLIALKLIERRVPATLPLSERQASKRSRYHVLDAFLRFYYRFIEPHAEIIEQGLVETLWGEIGEQFRAFIGMTVFEELCRRWVIAQARQQALPFLPETVGSHWAADAQVDVVAVNWREKKLLLGECKWGEHAVGQAVIRELVEKAPLVSPGPEWQVYYAFFTRAGFTDAARAEAQRHQAWLVDLAQLEAALAGANL